MKIIVRELIDRLKENLNIKNDSDIAIKLNIAQNTLSGAIKRNSLKFETFELILQLIIDESLSINWILYGLEEEKLDNSMNKKINIQEEFDKLNAKQQEYYYHRIKADVIKNELQESSND